MGFEMIIGKTADKVDIHRHMVMDCISLGMALKTDDVKHDVWLPITGHGVTYAMSYGCKVRKMQWTDGCYVELVGVDEDDTESERVMRATGTDVFKHDCQVFGAFVLEQLIDTLHLGSWQVMLTESQHEQWLKVWRAWRDEIAEMDGDKC
jgi:hypothetical protein